MHQAPNKEIPFRLQMPLEFLKGADGRRIIRGFCTTEHKDREKEIVLQDGLDFSEFLAHGWFNDNHSRDTGKNIGWPTKLERATTPDGKKGHFVEGELLRNYAPADQVWDFAHALKENAAPRQLGMSIEGAIDQRSGPDGKIISKARVRKVAVTADPINPYTGAEMVIKALMAGGDISAPAPTPGQGFPLRAESLEGGTKKKKRKAKKAGEAVDALVAKGYRADIALKLVLLAVANKKRRNVR